MAFKQYTQCINCLLCYAACPQCGLNENFVGPGGTGAGAPLQSRFPGSWKETASRDGGQQRGHLGMHLRWGLLGGLSEACGPRGGNSANENFGVARLAQGPLLPPGGKE